MSDHKTLSEEDDVTDSVSVSGKSPLETMGAKLYRGEKSFDFVHNWKRNIGIGAGLCAVAVVLLLSLGLNPGIEFRGGSEFRVTGVSDTSTDPAVEDVEALNASAGAPLVTVVGGDSIRVQTSKLTDEQTDQLRADLAKSYGVDTAAVTSSFVGPSWGKDVTQKALTGLFVFLVLVALLIAVYFRTAAMAGAALIALVHDLLITIGVFSASRFEVTPASVIGFLTILGYSLYDTVVVFDKVRENTAAFTRDTSATFAERANLAVNQTLVRSLNTSIVALLPVASILFIGAFLLGAGTLKDIALALFVGILVGTYSSIFVAPAAFILLTSRRPDIKAHNEQVHVVRAEVAQREASDHATDSAPPVKVAPGKQRAQPRRR